VVIAEIIRAAIDVKPQTALNNEQVLQCAETNGLI
jgi:hypothetical protein